MKTLTFAFVSFLVAAPLAAQVPGDNLIKPLPTQSERDLADKLSTTMVGISLAIDFADAWRSPDRTHALITYSERQAAVVGISEALKHLIHRTRPDGSDDQSFPSEHTMFAASTIGGKRFAISIPLTIGVAGGRITAGKHYLSDTVTGAVLGYMVGFLIR